VSEVRLSVDPISCTGVGMCAHAGGRVVDLDAWGFPVVPTSALTGRDARAARAAAKACPRRALFLLPVDPVDRQVGPPTNRIGEPADQASGEPPVTPRT
jgi:ferredoxin